MTLPPKLYMLVGVPGSGKTTWCVNQNWALGLTIVSTDVWVEHYARTQRKTYTEVFDQYMPTAINQTLEQVVHARENGHTIIWDQTSTTIKSRARKFHMLPDYDVIAVVFPTPRRGELARRLAARPDKVIPPAVLESMINDWQEPTMEEGFKEIWHVPDFLLYELCGD